MQMFKDMQKFKGVQMSNCFLKYLYWGCLTGSVGGTCDSWSQGRGLPRWVWSLLKINTCTDLHFCQQWVRAPTLLPIFTNTHSCPIFKFVPILWVGHVFVPLLLMSWTPFYAFRGHLCFLFRAVPVCFLCPCLFFFFLADTVLQICWLMCCR